MRDEDQQALVARLAGDFPIFAEATIARWVAHESAKYEVIGVGDAASLIEDALRATMTELSREGVATSHELPVARSAVTAGEGAKPRRAAAAPPP